MRGCMVSGIDVRSMYYGCEVKFALFIACGMSFFLPCSLYLVVCYVHDSSVRMYPKSELGRELGVGNLMVPNID